MKKWKKLKAKISQTLYFNKLWLSAQGLKISNGYWAILNYTLIENGKFYQKYGF